MKRILIAAAAALALAACSQQPTVAEVADAAGNGSVALIKEANGSAGAFAGTEASATLGELKAVADRAGVMPSLRFLPSPVAHAMARLATGEGSSDTSGVDARAEALGKFLRERIFTEANLESSGSDGLVFRITGEDVCGDGTTPADPDCVSSFDRFEVRIRVTRGMEGYRFYLELGPDRFEPLMVLLSTHHIAVGVDLAGVKSALVYLDTTAGQPVFAPKTLEGVFVVDLKKNGDQDFTLKSSVKEAIHVETDGEAGPVSFSTGAKDPWFTARIQGKQRTLSVDLDLGATDVHFPYRTLVPEGTAGQEIEAHLAGASASVALGAGAVSLDVKNIGLGDGQSTLALDGTDLLKVDLNPNSGRRFEVSLGVSGAGQLEIKVTPEFDLTTVFFYQPLQVDTDLTLPPYAVDSTYRFQLTGDSPTLAPAANGLKVTSGTLRLENSAHADQAVVVNTGKCLVTVVPAGEDPLIGQYAAQDCL